MKLRSTLILSALALASCWLAYEFGKRASVEAINTVSEKRVEARVVVEMEGFRESRSDQERTLMLLEALERCREAEEFRELLDELQFRADKTEENRLISLLFQGWLEVSPGDALAEVRRVESLRHDMMRVSRVFEDWAMNQPEEAKVLLQNILDGRQLDPSSRPPFLDGVDPAGYVLALVSGLSQTAPESMANLLQDAVASPVIPNAIDVLLQHWFANDSRSVFQWSSALEDSPFRERVIDRVAQKAGQLDDPLAGLEWAQALDPSSERGALKSLTGQWAQRHSRSAFQWVNQMTDEDLKFEIIPPVIAALAKIDPGGTADWLNQFEASPQLDPSVAAYALSISPVNPPAALGSAAAITGSNQREQVMLKIATEWSQISPGEFQAYLKNTDGLPASLYQLGK